MSKYTFFYGGPFCQWAHSPFVVDELTYNCAEQYMMAKKALLFGSLLLHKLIMDTTDPAEQKRLGKLVTGFSVERWQAVARDVVFRGNVAKFTQNKELRAELMRARGKFVEASPTDVVWGIGLAEGDPRCTDPAQWRGWNWLGQVLDEVRSALR